MTDIVPFPNNTAVDAVAKHNVAAKILLWLAENVLWKLVRCFYHVTETTFGRNELFYYRKRTWQSMISSTLESHKKRGILRELGSVSSVANLTGAEGRFLPKSSGKKDI
jgi:telomerase reverse transcriptase